MTRQQLMVLAAVLALLLGAVVLKRLQPPKALYTEEAESLEMRANADVVDRITITKGPGSPIELEKRGGPWQVHSLWGVKANEDRIRQLFESLADVTGEIRGHSEELFPDFGITDAQALHIVLSEGEDEVVHVLIGTESPDAGALFLRMANSSTVFLSRSTLLSRLGLYGRVTDATLDASVWADLRTFSFDPDEVSTIEVKDTEAGWRELGGVLPFQRDADQVRTYLQGLLGVRANGVVDPDGTEYGFEDPEWELRLTRRDADPIVVTVGALTTGSTTDRYLRLSDAPHVYEATRYTLERILVDGSRFIGADPLGVSDASVQALTVHVPGQDVSVSPEGEPWKGLKTYLQSLKDFHVAQIDGLPARTEGGVFDAYRLTLQMEGADPLTIACESPADDEIQEILCANQRNQIPFLIARSTFTSLFENLDRLKPPAPETGSLTDETQDAP